MKYRITEDWSGERRIYEVEAENEKDAIERYIDYGQFVRTAVPEEITNITAEAIETIMDKWRCVGLPRIEVEGGQMIFPVRPAGDPAAETTELRLPYTPELHEQFLRLGEILRTMAATN